MDLAVVLEATTLVNTTGNYVEAIATPTELSSSTVPYSTLATLVKVVTSPLVTFSMLCPSRETYHFCAVASPSITTPPTTSDMLKVPFPVAGLVLSPFYGPQTLRVQSWVNSQ